MAGNALPFIALAAGAFFLLKGKGGGGPASVIPPAPGTVSQIHSEADIGSIEAHFKSLTPEEISSAAIYILVTNNRSSNAFDETLLEAFKMVASGNAGVQFYATGADIAAAGLGPEQTEAARQFRDQDAGAAIYMNAAKKKIAMAMLYNPESVDDQFKEDAQKFLNESAGTPLFGMAVDFRIIQVPSGTSANELADEFGNMMMEPRSVPISSGPTPSPTQILSALFG